MDPRCSRMAFGLSVLFFSSPLLAQATPSLDPVVVTATRTPVSLTDVLADVSWVDRDQIDRMGAASVAEVLARLPGITLSQAGGPASTTGVFIRGADSRFTAVFIDGVRVDTQSGDGGAPWEAIPLTQVDRIEVLRGPAAAVYGSDAIGGVVQIFTREGEQGFHPSVRLGAGTYGTREANASLRGGVGDVTYSLGLAKDQSDGFDATLGLINPDRDGYQKDYVSAKFEKRISADTQIGSSLKYSTLNADYDRGYSSDLTTDVHKFKITNQSVSGYLRQVVNADWVSNVSLTRSEYKYNDSLNGAAWPATGITNSLTQGWQTALAWNNTYQLQSQTKAVFGIDLANDTFNGSGSSSAYALTRRSQGYFAGLTHQIDRFTLQANLRHDDFRLQQDSASIQSDTNVNTGLLGIGYQLNQAWRLTGTLSTGFSVPTADAVSTNSNIKPEHHQAKEIGATYQINETLLRAIYFQKNATDAVIYTNTYVYVNGDIDNKGIELTARTNSAGYSVKSSVTIQDPRDIAQNLPQARRAKQYGSLDISRNLSGLDIGEIGRAHV